MNTLQTDRPYDVIAFGAHPDDVEMGMGGTVAGLVESGRRVAIVVLTHGEIGTYGDAQTRTAEAAEAARVLGCDVRILDHHDGQVVDDLGGRHEIARLLRELRPRLVFAPYADSRTGPRDGRSNVDHLATGALVRNGSKLARFRKLMPEVRPHTIGRLLYYMVPDDHRPSFIVDVSAQKETLKRCIDAYASQMAINRAGRPVRDMLMLWRQTAGMRIGVELGEPFVCEDAIGGPVDLLLEI